ncbi:MAG: response regulator [Acidobacteriia bacterium]|nr:response regulator [Terriglobia bacterium]
MGHKSSLLCIHRDPLQLRLLREHGYELATATTSSDGLRLFKSRPVDAIVLEHDLSLLDGAAIAEEIKQTQPNIPIILLADHVELPASALKSIDALVVKSDGPHFLLATVYFILNMKPAQSHQTRSQARARLPHPRRTLVTDRETPLSRRVWRSIQNGDIQF